MSKGGKGSPGSFRDEFEQLLEQLATQPVIELGKPIPNKKHLPRTTARSPAEHNRALLDRAEEDEGAEAG